MKYWAFFIFSELGVDTSKCQERLVEIVGNGVWAREERHKVFQVQMAQSLRKKLRLKTHPGHIAVGPSKLVSIGVFRTEDLQHVELADFRAAQDLSQKDLVVLAFLTRSSSAWFFDGPFLPKVQKQ
jgi:hypothetical protein